ncbi:hypothetical protein D3C85_457100 [compost metagenome]
MILVPGPGRDILAQAISASPLLPVPIEPDHLKLTPSVFVGMASPTHARVKAIASPLSPYQGAVTVNYARMDLNKAFGDIVPRYEGVSTGTLYSIFPGLSQLLGIRLSEEDFLDADYSWLDYDETTNLKLEAKSSSVAYQGYFIVRFTRRRIMLENVVKKPNLYALLDVGRTYRAPPKPGPGVPAFTVKDSVDMATYGTDFTPYRDAFRLSRRYPMLFINPTAVANVLQQLFGFGQWYSGWNHTVTRYRTVDRPEARQDFEFVIIQRVTDPYYPYYRKNEGTAYFHYNETELIESEEYI